MNTRGRHAIAHILRRKREALGLSATQVARRAQVDPGTVTRIELAQINEPTPASLKAIAGVLGVPTSDLFVVAEWIPAHELPSLLTYLRGKYGEIPRHATQEIEDLLANLGANAQRSNKPIDLTDAR